MCSGACYRSVVTVPVAASVSQSTGVSQNGVIFAVLLIGFVVYLTLSGRLAAYVNLFFASKAKPASAVPTSQSNTGGGTPATQAASGQSATTPLQPLQPLQSISSDASNSASYDSAGSGEDETDFSIYNTPAAVNSGSGLGDYF